MGRHGRANCAARRPIRTRPTAAGAARYVGRVGAFALTLGVGVAVAGGAGVASADDTSDDSGDGSAQSASGSTAGEGSGGGAGAVDAPADGSSGATTRTPGSPTAPKKMVFSGTGGALTSGPPGPGRARAAESVSIASVPSTAVRPKPSSAGTGSTRPSSADTTPQSAPAAPEGADVGPVATMVSSVAAVGVDSSAGTGDSPRAPMPLVPGALQLISREIERNAHRQASAGSSTGVAPRSLVTPAAATTTALDPAAPNPGDVVVDTPYGDIGKWMLQSNGQISTWGGRPYDGRTLLEPINVIVIDPTSTTPAESAAKLDTAMSRAGFPAQGLHSTGFQGTIDGETYGQQPNGILEAFSDNFFLLPNDHGRMFGPAPVENGTGYVWTGAFSTEQLATAGQFGHEYVSFGMARDALAARLVASGAATVVGVVRLDNAYGTATLSTGDHDGYAVVLRLNPMVLPPAPRHSSDDEDDPSRKCRSVEDLLGSHAWHQAVEQCVVVASTHGSGRHARV